MRGDYVYRGHNIEKEDGIYVYSDTREPVRNNVNRACGKCGLDNTTEGHDSCLGTLPGVMNACCGHGKDNEAYVQLLNRTVISGTDAIELIGILKL